MTLLSKKNKRKAVIYGAFGILCFVLHLKFYCGLICFVLAIAYFLLAKKAEKNELGIEEELVEMENLLSKSEEDYTEKDKKKMKKMMSAFGKNNDDFTTEENENEEIKALNKYIAKLDKELAELENVSDYDE